MKKPDTVVVVFDLVLRRPGCALLQAALGGSPGIANQFPTRSWLTAPTPDMQAYQITQEDLKHLVTSTRKKYGRI